jgi:hypothetical protein
MKAITSGWSTFDGEFVTIHGSRGDGRPTGRHTMP